MTKSVSITYKALMVPLCSGSFIFSFPLTCTESVIQLFLEEYLIYVWRKELAEAKKPLLFHFSF